MKSQTLPIVLTVLSFFGLGVILFLFLHILNLFPLQSKIVLTLHPLDILVGLTIYIKTAIDFALFIGTLMHRHPGVKNRIAIELGTSLGNGIGTLLILAVWIFFKEVPVLLTIMVFLASLVLLRMAEDGLAEYLLTNAHGSINNFLTASKRILFSINKIFDPLLGKLLPRYSQKEKTHATFWSLFVFAVTIPFLLGLDDFAGYIPLFSIINVFGFAIGVFLGHMLLTASLFAFPEKTAQFVRQPIILVFGSFVFVGLSLWGLVEVGKSLLTFIH